MRGLFAIVLTLLVPVASAQIAGTVYDAETGTPLPGATITVEGALPQGTTADAAGRFSLPGLTGRVLITARFVGFGSSTREVEADQGLTRIDFHLEPVATSLDEVLVEQASMTGGLLGIQDMMGSAHLVTARNLERFGTTDVHRALRAVPGVTVQEEDGYGLRPNIGLRGSGSERSSRITVMEDGVLVAPAPYAASAAYYFPTMGRMSGVEVVKGSSQIMYGPFTTGGAINLLSTPIPSSRAGNLTLLAGNDNNLLAHATVGDSRGRLSYLLETHQQRTDGFKELDGGNDTGFQKGDYLAKVRLSSPGDARLRQSLLLKASLTNELSNETYLGLTSSDFSLTPLRRYAGSQADRMKADQRQFLLRHRIWPLEGLEVVTSAYATRFHRNWYKLDRVTTADESIGIGALLDDPGAHAEAYAALVGASPASRLSLKANNRIYHSRGVQTDARLDLAGASVSFGARAHFDEMDRFQWLDDYQLDGQSMTQVQAGAPGTDSNRLELAHAAAGYAQVQFDRGRFSLKPGFRVEHVIQKRRDFGKSDPDRTGSSLSTRRNQTLAVMPGVGASFQFQPEWTVFAGIHKGFSPPGTTEGTKPESSVNYELGSRLWRGPARVEAVAFLSDYDNLLGSDLAASGGTGSTDQFNGGEALVRGLELSGSYNLGALLDWKASLPVAMAYTVTMAEFSSSFESEFEPWGAVNRGDELPYQPRHQLSGMVAWERSAWEVSLAGAWVGEMRTVAGSGTPDPNQRVGARLVLDLSLDATIGRGVSAFAVIRNLTDEIYVAARRPAGIRPGMPRSFMAGVRAGF